MRLNTAESWRLAASLLAIASLTACHSAKDQSQAPGAVQAAGSEKEPAWRSVLGLKPQTVDVTVPAGSPLRVRLDHAVATNTTSPGERFTGSLVEPVVVNGAAVIPPGAKVEGVVRHSAPSGRLKGRAVLSLAVERIEWDGQSHQVETTSYTRTSSGHKKRNWTLIGGGSGVGALVGGLAGGGKGAAIGAGAGAAAGTAGAAITGKRQVQIPAEALLSFKTRQPLNVKFTPSAAKQEQS